MLTKFKQGRGKTNIEQLEYYNESRKGYVYVIQWGDRFKIGKSKNVKKRKATLTLGKDAKIILERFSNNYHLLESLLHALVQSKQISGEWFELTKEDIEKIKNY